MAVLPPIVKSETLCYHYRNMAIHIGIQIERSRAHGRALLAGVAEYALGKPDWRFDLIGPDELADPRALAQFDGLIVRVMDDATARALGDSGRPVIDTYGRIDRSPFDTIRLDDAAIARMAAECFAAHHFEKCAFCGFRGPRFSSARGEAFVAEVRASGRTCYTYEGEESSRLDDTFFRDERTDYIPDASALRRWIKSLPKPIAVFCCNDIRAFQFMKVCEASGVSVPSDVAVLGVDDDIVLGMFTRPPLSSINTDPFSLGRRAGEMLAERMGMPPGAAPRIELHAPRRVVERASTATYPFRTPWLSDAMVFISRNISSGINANDVIAKLGYSHTAVNNAFRAELGTSVHAEIMKQRLALACRLLKETDHSAAKIAAESGFLTPQYFSRAFSAAFGTTPDNWRKRNTP